MKFIAGVVVGLVLGAIQPVQTTENLSGTVSATTAQAEEAATREVAQVNAYFKKNPLPGVVSIRFGNDSGWPELRIVAGDELAFQWSEANREKRLVVMQRLARAVLSMALHFGGVTVLLFDLNGNQIDQYTEFR
jgi:hypothetical protein